MGSRFYPSLRYLALATLLTVMNSPNFATGTEGSNLCEVSFLREQTRLQKLYLPAGFKPVKFWLFGPEGFRDAENAVPRKFARVTLSKGRGYLLAASTPLQGNPLTVEALTSTGEVMPLDGTAQIDNREVRFRVNRACGSFLLMGTLKPAPKPMPAPTAKSETAGAPPSDAAAAPETPKTCEEIAARMEALAKERLVVGNSGDREAKTRFMLRSQKEVREVLQPAAQALGCK